MDAGVGEKAPRFWRRWWRFVAARIGIAALVLLLLMPLLVLSLAPPSRPAEEPPPPWWHDLQNGRLHLIVPDDFYDRPRPEIIPDDITLRDCAPQIRVLRPADPDGEAPSRPAEQHCPGL